MKTLIALTVLTLSFNSFAQQKSKEQLQKEADQKLALGVVATTSAGLSIYQNKNAKKIMKQNTSNFLTAHGDAGILPEDLQEMSKKAEAGDKVIIRYTTLEDIEKNRKAFVKIHKEKLHADNAKYLEASKTLKQLELDSYTHRSSYTSPATYQKIQETKSLVAKLEAEITQGIKAIDELNGNETKIPREFIEKEFIVTSTGARGLADDIAKFTSANPSGVKYFHFDRIPKSVVKKAVNANSLSVIMASASIVSLAALSKDVIAAKLSGTFLDFSSERLNQDRKTTLEIDKSKSQSTKKVVSSGVKSAN